MSAQSFSRPSGLRPTLRHQMIAIVYFAVIFAIVDAVRKRGIAETLGVMTACGLLLTPWILGVLVMVLDRPGPQRNWTVTSIFMLFAPGIALYYDSVTVATYWRTGTIYSVPLTLFMNLFFFGSYAIYWKATGPQTCPLCNKWALIPLVRLSGPTRRTEKTRWCAACGGLLWRLGNGPWQKERRRTWLDGAVVDIVRPFDDDDPPGPAPTSPEVAHSAACQGPHLDVTGAARPEITVDAAECHSVTA